MMNRLVKKQVKGNMEVSLVYLENYDRLEGKGYEVAIIKDGEIEIVGMFGDYYEALNKVEEIVKANESKTEVQMTNPQVKKLLIPVMYDTFRGYEEEDEDRPQFEICVEATHNCGDSDDTNVYVNVFVNIDGELSDHDHEVAICSDMETALKYVARCKKYLAKDIEIGMFVK